MTVTVTRDEVIAFRLGVHNLGERLPEDQAITATGVCGIQDSPPGSALTALHARVENMTRQKLDGLIADEKSLVCTWAMRGAPFFFPTVDLSVFTTGMLPMTERSLRHFVLGVESSVDELGLDLGDLVGRAETEVRAILPGRRLTITELGAEVADRIAPTLTAAQRKVWENEGPYAKGQSLGAGVVHFCVRILTLRQVLCFAPREGRRAPFVLHDEWLGSDDPSPRRGTGAMPGTDSPGRVSDPDDARRELLRRYLHSYGPSTRADFAAWLGIRSTEAQEWWDLVNDDLAEVDFDGRRWMLAEDVDTLKDATMPTGVRLLPPRDPYTQMRDRSTIVEKKHHSDVWKTVGEPGALLIEGEVSGTWRARMKGTRLEVTLTPFASLAASLKKALTVEAEAIGALREAKKVDVTFTSARGAE
jgi:hypothetical protein